MTDRTPDARQEVAATLEQAADALERLRVVHAATDLFRETGRGPAVLCALGAIEIYGIRMRHAIRMG